MLSSLWKLIANANHLKMRHLPCFMKVSSTESPRPDFLCPGCVWTVDGQLRGYVFGPDCGHGRGAGGGPHLRRRSAPGQHPHHDRLLPVPLQLVEVGLEGGLASHRHGELTDVGSEAAIRYCWSGSHPVNLKQFICDYLVMNGVNI